MFKIKNNNNNNNNNNNDNNNNNNFDYNNCVFSVGISRPSKSLINCELYKEFSKINTNLEILNEFSFTSFERYISKT